MYIEVYRDRISGRESSAFTFTINFRGYLEFRTVYLHVPLLFNDMHDVLVIVKTPIIIIILYDFTE